MRKNEDSSRNKCTENCDNTVLRRIQVILEVYVCRKKLFKKFLYGYIMVLYYGQEWYVSSFSASTGQ